MAKYLAFLSQKASQVTPREGGRGDTGKRPSAWTPVSAGASLRMRRQQAGAGRRGHHQHWELGV